MKYKKFYQDDRYFAGIEHHTEITFGELEDVNDTWSKMLGGLQKEVLMKTEPHQMIGLNCNSIDYDETNKVTYYALVETIDLIKQKDFIVTKKIPKGNYISFDIEYDNLGLERKRVYDYCKTEGIKVHKGFDYEHYISGQRYSEKGAIVTLCLMIEDD